MRLSLQVGKGHRWTAEDAGRQQGLADPASGRTGPQGPPCPPSWTHPRGASLLGARPCPPPQPQTFPPRGAEWLRGGNSTLSFHCFYRKVSFCQKGKIKMGTAFPLPPENHYSLLKPRPAAHAGPGKSLLPGQGRPAPSLLGRPPPRPRPPRCSDPGEEGGGTGQEGPRTEGRGRREPQAPWAAPEPSHPHREATRPGRACPHSSFQNLPVSFCSPAKPRGRSVSLFPGVCAPLPPHGEIHPLPACPLACMKPC